MNKDDNTKLEILGKEVTRSLKECGHALEELEHIVLRDEIHMARKRDRRAWRTSDRRNHSKED